MFVLTPLTRSMLIAAPYGSTDSAETYAANGCSRPSFMKAVMTVQSGSPLVFWATSICAWIGQQLFLIAWMEESRCLHFCPSSLAPWAPPALSSISPFIIPDPQILMLYSSQQSMEQYRINRIYTVICYTKHRMYTVPHLKQNISKLKEHSVTAFNGCFTSIDYRQWKECASCFTNVLLNSHNSMRQELL